MYLFFGKTDAITRPELNTKYADLLVQLKDVVKRALGMSDEELEKKSFADMAHLTSDMRCQKADSNLAVELSDEDMHISDIAYHAFHEERYTDE